MTRIYVFLLVLILSIAAACGRKRDSLAPVPAVATEATAPDSTGMPAPSKEGITRLCNDENAYIKNNAKQALSSWEAKDYQAAVIAMQKVLSLCQADSQRQDALSSLAQLKQDIDRAAAKGNANAKDAAAQLAQ